MSESLNAQLILSEYKKGETYKGLKDFDCGDELLNHYARDFLKKNGERNNRKQFLLLDPQKNRKVVGFVSLHLDIFGREKIPEGTFLYQVPPVVPVMKLSMLAVTNEYQKNGWGSELLFVALEHAYKVAKVANDLKGVILDAKEAAVEFYKRHRFSVIETSASEQGESSTLMYLSMQDLDQVMKKLADAEASKSGDVNLG
ncbi:hypothetical protein NB703_003969 [Pantoea ananatis]|uniref:N-acetyltransferase domain-containing protein n=1 Tax=Pantoea ananas TaxID=553 RepID=A0AAJ1D3T9_PANAN|nr:GNAT family N-acetyltransferase [Pantoea ananatis]MCW0345876.1 hypothetical protein [Pantoea ananatis]